jgi:hypothetical protein
MDSGLDKYRPSLHGIQKKASSLLPRGAREVRLYSYFHRETCQTVRALLLKMFQRECLQATVYEPKVPLNKSALPAIKRFGTCRVRTVPTFPHVDDVSSATKAPSHHCQCRCLE